MTSAILLPVDISDGEDWRKALDVAVAQARQHKAALHVASVLPDLGTALVGGFFKPGFEADALARLGASLTEWTKANVPEDVDVHPHVLHGKIYDEILRAADRLGVDLIVMGSHRPALADYLLGPNAARVVRHAKQSVYVVR
ncbi:MAG: universal stress protein [Rubrimonas sp.]|uniref:universal stress protein n=1 Tax=Rubrimonas sp. TaxID=2036015 RepID=UPI002FDE3CF3